MFSISNRPILYLVTDERFSKDTLDKAIESAIEGGVNLVQLREKELSSRKFYEKAVEIKKITDYYKIPLIINDRLDIAQATAAAGVHLGQSDLPLSVARNILGEEKIIGISAATVEEAIEAQKNGASYLGVGAIFKTDTKKDTRAVSLETLKHIKGSVNIPVIAIGGINEDNAAHVMSTGIDGIAVVSCILSSCDIQQAAKGLYHISLRTLKK